MKDSKKRSKIGTIFKNAITDLDMFGTEMDAQFQIDDIHLYKSFLGTLLTVLFVVTMGMYTIYKYQIMKHYNDTSVMISVDENYFDQNYTMQARKGNF